jgi:hypothetical protein
VLVHYYVTTRFGSDIEEALINTELIPPAPSVEAPVHDGGGGTPKPPAAPAVAPARPELSRRGGVRVRRAGRALVVQTGDRVSCPAGGPVCVLRVRGSAAGRAVGSSRADVTAGRAARVSFRLNRRGVRALTRHRRLRLRVALAARAGNGAAVAQERRLTIRLP